MVQGIARWGSEFLVGRGPAVDAASIAGLSPKDGISGRFVIVYGQGTTDHAGIGDTQGIVCRIYNADGTPHGEPFRINNITTAEQWFPVIVDRVDGEGFAVAWADNSRRSDNWGSDIRMRLFDFDGNAETNGFLVHSSTRFDNEIQPSIDRVGTNGTIFVAYDNGIGTPNDGMGVYGRVFSNATAITGNLPISAAVTPSGETNTEGQANVTDIPTTGFLVTWTDSIDAGQTFGSGSAIRGRLYTHTGAALGSEFDVATIEGFNLRDPVAAAFADGSYIVGWTQDDDAGGAFDRNVYARIFTAEGVGGTPFLVHQDAAGQQLSLSLTPFGPDKVIAVWHHQTTITGNIHVRVFNSDGTAFSEEMIVEAGFATQSSVLPSVAVLQEGTIGRFVVTWRNNSTSEIRGQIFDIGAASRGIDFFGSDRAESYAARSYTDPLYPDEHVLYGNGGNDTLTGSAEADTLDGGTGDDSMTGGAGDDLYLRANADDVIVEAANGGHDTVRTNANYNLLWAPNVEDLVITGRADTPGVSGNALANRIEGNVAANAISGREGNDTLLGGDGNDTLNGGAGADTLRGGSGDDVYVKPIQDGPEADRIIDDPDAGIDTVQTNESFHLTDLPNTENVTLTGGNTATALGNGLDNVLTGNAGRNTLQGVGGDDTLDGGGDRDILWGHEGRDRLAGGAGNDLLIGGEDNDTMDGGSGADTFRFATANTGSDRIEGFETAFDRFDLAGGDFTARSHANGNTVLTHAGGEIVIVGITGLSLSAWNDLVLPAGGSTAADEPTRPRLDFDFVDMGLSLQLFAPGFAYFGPPDILFV